MGDDRTCVSAFGWSGVRREISRPGGRPTGLAVDGDNCLWVAGGERNSLVKLSPKGEVLLAIYGDEQGPFLFPNDLAFGPDGLLYMTNSGMTPDEFIEGFAIRPDFATVSYDGRVFQIDPSTGRVLRRLASGLLFTNGIAFDPFGVLHYAETITGTIFRQEIGREPEVFARTQRSTDRFQGPDGMAFGVSGNLYCAIYGAGHVAVIGPDGHLLRPLETNGDRPTNVTFGRNPGELYVTEVEHGCIESISVEDFGLALNVPAIPP